MNGRLYINNFSTTLAAPAGAADTTLSLATIARLQDLAVREPSTVFGADNVAAEYQDAGAFVALTLEPDGGADTAADIEIVHVYRVVTSAVQDLLVTRGEEGTTAKDWAAGAIVSARYTANAANPFFRYSGGDRSIDILPNGSDAPLAGVHGGDIEFVNQVNISPNNALCYGQYSVNIGTGGAGDGQVPTASFADGSAVINIGPGGVSSSSTDGGESCTEAMNFGTGGAYGGYAINFGEGGAGQFSTNFLGGGAFPGATNEGEGAFNWGDAGVYSVGGINIGNGGGGPAANGVTIGRNSSGGGSAGVAIGYNASNFGNTSCVAIGADTNNTAANQVHGGDRDLELGTATSSRGVHLYSPNGTRYKITVDDAGAVTAAADPIV